MKWKTFGINIEFVSMDGIFETSGIINIPTTHIYENGYVIQAIPIKLIEEEQNVLGEIKAFIGNVLGDELERFDKR